MMRPPIAARCVVVLGSKERVAMTLHVDSVLMRPHVEKNCGLGWEEEGARYDDVGWRSGRPWIVV